MKPGEHKTVQARILEYAGAIGWTFVPREEAGQRRGFDLDVAPAKYARIRCSPCWRRWNGFGAMKAVDHKVAFKLKKYGVA